MLFSGPTGLSILFAPLPRNHFSELFRWGWEVTQLLGHIASPWEYFLLASENWLVSIVTQKLGVCKGKGQKYAKVCKCYTQLRGFAWCEGTTCVTWSLLQSTRHANLLLATSMTLKERTTDNLRKCNADLSKQPFRSETDRCFFWTRWNLKFLVLHTIRNVKVTGNSMTHKSHSGLIWI